MCGRYQLAADREKIAEAFGVELEQTPALRYNIAPGQEVAVVRPTLSGSRRMDLLRWGLIPNWAKDETIGWKLINARAETAFDKPAFAEPMRRRRCLLPATGFYEWRREGRKKTPFCFTMADGGLFALGGVWDRWRAADGRVIDSVAILTTEPNELMREVHERMPVIVAAENYAIWLDHNERRPERIAGLCAPFAAEKMRRAQVGSRVNHVKFDDESCAEAVISV